MNDQDFILARAGGMNDQDFILATESSFTAHGHPEHRYITNPQTGQRAWHYGPAMLSLDGLAAGADGERSESHLLGARQINAFCHTATISFAPSHATRSA